MVIKSNRTRKTGNMMVFEKEVKGIYFVTKALHSR